MIVCDATDEKIIAVLAAAVATTQPNVVVSFIDKTSTTTTPGGKESAMNSTTDVDITDVPGASTQRCIEGISFHNLDTAQVTVTIRHDKGGTSKRLIKCTVSPDQTLEYAKGRWELFTPSGAAPGHADGRLTLTTGTAVTTADVFTATSVYLSRYKGSQLDLHDGSAAWNKYTIPPAGSEVSVALGTLADATFPRDVFAYASSGAIALEKLVWTSATGRATDLTLQDGILVKTGDTTRRYLGTFFPDTTTTVEDSTKKRYLWNYYNRCKRLMQCYTTTNAYNYDSTTIREAEGGGGTYGVSRVGFVIGWNEDLVQAINHAPRHATSGTYAQCGIGLDVTNAFTNGVGDILYAIANESYLANSIPYRGYPGVGFHFLCRTEKGNGATCDFYGDNGGSQILGIMYAEVWG